MQVLESGGKSKFEIFLKLKGWFLSLSYRRRVALIIGGSLFLLSLSAIVTLATFSYIIWNKDSGPKARYRSTKSLAVKIGEPKDFESSINGVLFTRSQGEIFDKRRPMAVMIDNHADAKQIQAGLPDADIIFEAVAEGGITRLLAIYYAKDSDKIGPVRSARVHFLDLASEFHPWFAHWGGAATPGSPANAYDYMAKNGIANLDAMWLGECQTCPYWRDLDASVAAEHTGFTSTQKLYSESAKRWPGWSVKVPFDRFLFKDDSKEGERPSSGSFSFNFWDLPDYAATWTYDPAQNVYLRSQGGKPHKDAVTGQQLSAKNIIVQFTPERSANDGTPHLLYQTIGEGAAKIFLDGSVLDATWKKVDRLSRTRYFDESGAEVRFNRGQIWVEVVPVGNEITYSGS